MIVGSKHKIESDDLNVTVYEKRESKEGKEDTWRPIGYFSRIDNALKFLVDRGVKETGLKDLKTVAQKQQELYELIESLELPRNSVQPVSCHEKALAVAE